MNLDLGDTRLILRYAKGLPLKHQAYILATVYHETAQKMKPVKEAFWLDDAWRKKNLRYYPWFGRGYVQLTWEWNYKKASEKTGVDLISNPDRAMNPVTAAKILVIGMKEGWFTGKKLSDYSDYFNSRRIINGMDRAEDIAAIARKYEALLGQKPTIAALLAPLLAAIRAIIKAVKWPTK